MKHILVLIFFSLIFCSSAQIIKNNGWTTCNYRLGGQSIECKINIKVTDKYITTNIDGVFTEYELIKNNDCTGTVESGNFTGKALDGTNNIINYWWYARGCDRYTDSDLGWITIKSPRGNEIIRYGLHNYID